MSTRSFFFFAINSNHVKSKSHWDEEKKITLQNFQLRIQENNIQAAYVNKFTGYLVNETDKQQKIEKKANT